METRDIKHARKIKGNNNVAKLRAEEDFNGMSKIIYNSRVFPGIEVCRPIPYEVTGGRRGKLSQHASLGKKLVYDVGNKTMHTTVVTSTDTINWYDRIAHQVVSMKNQYFGVQLEHMIFLFAIMHSIKMFPRTSYRV